MYTPSADSKATVPTPAGFTRGATANVGATNTKTDTTNMGRNLRVKGGTNLRNARRDFVNNEGNPSLPTNPSPRTPPK